MKKNRFVELLSPAGSLDKMLFAFEYGADAVYLGAKSFSLREGATNFTIEELIKAIDLAHMKNKKVYLTANIFFHNSHFTHFKEFIKEISFLSLDGLVLSDIGAITFIREKYPDIPIHVSTQANTTHSEAVKFFEKLGASRIILARELSLPEIREIRESTTLELEAFIHGAMCIAYSGRCLLSNYFTNQSLYKKGEKLGNMKRIKTRDANLGDCAQSCRWEYNLIETTRENELLPISEGEFGTAILSSKDLNLSSHMKELIETGIDSFKIEGRMKSIYYVSNVTRVYRHAIDRALQKIPPDDNILAELNTISHREYTTGFYFSENLALAPTRTSKYIRDYIFLGHVTKRIDKLHTEIQAMNQILPGKPIEIICQDGSNKTIVNYKLLKEGISTDKIQPNDQFTLVLDKPLELEKYNILRRKL